MESKAKSVGTQLREARHARGWTPKAAAKATKIKEQQILQIENEEYNKFAAPAYVRGFVRIYAKTLGLNETKVLHDLDKILAAEGDDVYLSSSPVQYMPGESRWRKAITFRGLSFWMMIFLALGIFGILAYRVYLVWPSHPKTVAVDKAKVPVNDIPVAPAAAAHGAPGGEAPPKAEMVAPAVAVGEEPTAKAEKAEPVAPAVPVATTAPSATPAASAAPATPAQEGNLTFQVHQDCYVRISLLQNNQATQIFEGVLKASEKPPSFAGDRFLIKVAIPAAVDILFNGNVFHSNSKNPTDLTLPLPQAPSPVPVAPAVPVEPQPQTPPQP